MKNATAYEKKIRKLLASMPRKAQPEAPKGLDCFTLLIEAVLQADVPRKSAREVLSEFHAEFVDYNELRVAPMKDVTDCMPRDFWGAREKADSLLRGLNAIFDHTSSMSMEYMEKMPKRDLRKHLMEVGLSPYAAALVTLLVFGGHAIPVDQALVSGLELEEAVHPGSDLTDVQGFLERIIPQKDAYAAHEFFRDFVEKNYKTISKKLKEVAATKEPPPAKEEPPVPQEASFEEVLAEPGEPQAKPKQPAPEPPKGLKKPARPHSQPAPNAPHAPRAPKAGKGGKNPGRK